MRTNLAWRRGIVSLLALVVCAAARGETLAPVVETTIGIEGVYYVRHRGTALEVVPFEENAPIVLRIANVDRDTSTGDGQSMIYELRYIGTRAGEHDLRDYLVRVDGQPINGLAPLTVQVSDLLPTDHDGVLETIDGVGLPWLWPYRWLLVLVAIIWLAPLVWLIRRKLTRRAAPRERRDAQPATLAEQLRPLVEAAVSGQLDWAGKARLERLLIGYWRERLDLDGLATQAALARLRADANAGELLRQLEAWLHQRPGTVTVNAAAILAPYLNVAAIRLVEEEAVDHDVQPAKAIV
ncbi:MAG: hypothetical protein IIA67_07335 [Planctomycetes bacterium]|nr:hypothetical protein [Planctomycetota bacterium]